MGKGGPDQDAASLQLLVIGPVGDERDPTRARRLTIRPGVPHDEDLPQVWPALGDHPEPIGVGLQMPHLLPGDDQVQVRDQGELFEHVAGRRTVIVGPHRGPEPQGADRPEGLQRAGFELDLQERPPLMGEGDLPEIGLEARRLLPDEARHLGSRPARLPRRERHAPLPKENQQVLGHRAKIERGANQGVIQVEDEDARSGHVALLKRVGQGEQRLSRPLKR